MKMRARTAFQALLVTLVSAFAITARPAEEISPIARAPELSVFSGQVLSSGRIPVPGATVHLVPAAAIDMTPITGTGVYQAPFPATAFDEPLEDAIALEGQAFPSGRSDSEGRFAIAGIPDGRYFVHVTPGPGDTQHLPGGDRSRRSFDAKELRGGSLTIAVSSRPSAAAKYVGSSTCLECHEEHVGWQRTGHKLAWSVPGKPGPAQDFSLFPHWHEALEAWISTGDYTEGTHLEAGDYKAEGGAVKFVIRRAGDPRLPIERVYADIYLWRDGADRYFITLSNRLNPDDSASPAHLPVELLYGGGVHRQRYIVSVPPNLDDRQGMYTLLQYNPDGRDNHLDSHRRAWRDYKLSYWWSAGPDDRYGTADDHIKAPPVNDNSIQSMCAGCHVTGLVRHADPETGQVLVSGVDDPNGAMNIDDDPAPDEINIGCETCHGPGSEHVDNAGLADFLEMATVNPAYLSAERASVVCGRCHDRRSGIGPRKLAYTQPIDAEGRIMPPGGSRAELLGKYSAIAGPKPHKALWDDDIHSRKPHQQYADFLKSSMYRNDQQLVTCSDCHQMHGTTPYRRWLLYDPDDPRSPLCQHCHQVDVLAHMEQQLNSKMKGLATRCIDCHMPGTMIAGGDAGAYGRLVAIPPYASSEEETASVYWEGHINSHVFDVPMKTNIAVGGVRPGKAMPIPYTKSCGTCHRVDELPHK
jgi:hypothetical protein